MNIVKFDSWYKLQLRALINYGEKHEDRTGVGTRRRFAQCASFDVSNYRLPLLTLRKMNAKIIATELAWFIQGRTDVKWLQERNVKIWDVDKWQDEFGTIGPNYGFQWRHFNGVHRCSGEPYEDSGVDQLKELCEELQVRSNSRRLIISAWNPEQMHLIPLPPCIVMLQFQVSGNTLNCMMVQRSCDFFVGFPHDIAQYSMLMFLLCKSCGLQPGTLTHMVGDLHVYENHIEQANEIFARRPFPSPTFELTALGRLKIEDKGFEGLLEFDCENKNYKPDEVNKDHFTLANHQEHGPIKVKVSE